MKATKLTIAGYEFVCGLGKNGYWIAVPDVEKAMGWRANSGREKLEAKSLKALAEAESTNIQVGKSKIEYQNQRYSCMSTQTFFLILNNEANAGNTKVLPFLVALAKEALERRIDEALGVTVAPETRELSTKEFCRKLHRESYIPKFSCWNDTGIEYAKFCNAYKRALGLPTVNIDEYSEEQLKLWVCGIETYNTLRHTGFTHEESTSRAKLILADVD